MINHDLTVTGTVLINADTEKVWKVLTEPEIIGEYLYGTDTVTDWKTGSKIIFQGEWNGQKYRDKGIVLDNKPGELLSYSYWSGFSGLPDEPENYSTIVYSLKLKGDKLTEFVWTQKGFANDQGQKHSQEGMEGLLQKIKEIAER